jgi:hypothetical protein
VTLQAEVQRKKTVTVPEPEIKYIALGGGDTILYSRDYGRNFLRIDAEVFEKWASDRLVGDDLVDRFMEILEEYSSITTETENT